MNTELIVNYLDTFNARELFYQNYWAKKAEPAAFADYLSSLAPEQLADDHLLVPELWPLAEEPAVLPESRYFSEDGDKNILLEKFDRLAPSVFHTHTFFHIIYVLRGTCLHRVFGREETLAQGDICLISPALAHAVFVDSDSLVLNIIIRKADMENIFYSALRDRNQISDFLVNSIYLESYATYLTFHTKDDKEIQEQILEMYMEQQFHGDLYSDRIISSMLVIFFTRLARNYKRTAHTPPEAETGADAAQFLHYILRDYRTITLSSLAQSMNYSVPYCSKHIKEVTGYTFLQLLQRTRFQKAENYLRSSSLSIHKISALLGYENPENFIRAFKKVYGVSPARFRAQHT